MKIYWYWPHPHRTPSALAQAVLRPGDTLVVQALESYRGERLSAGEHPYRVVRDLPTRTSRPRESRAARLMGALATDVRRGVRRRRLVRQVSPDVIHVQLLRYATDWLDLPALARRWPVVAVVHDVLPHDRELPACVEQALHRLLYRPACAPDLIVFQASLAALLQARFGVAPERIHQLPHPVVRATGLGERCDSERRTVLFLGSLRENKGVRAYLEALEDLGGIPGVSFHIAGAGAPHLEGAVRAAAGRLPWVTAEIGHYSEAKKRELLAGAAFLVLPYTSAFTSQSGVLMDAYAYGVPVIATDVGGMGATVREDETGWLVRDATPACLRSTIAEALADREGYRRRQVNVERAAAAHDVSVVGPLLRRIYERAADRHA